MDVSYQVVSSNVVRKAIRIRQSDMFLLWSQCSNTVQPQDRLQSSGASIKWTAAASLAGIFSRRRTNRAGSRCRGADRCGFSQRLEQDVSQRRQANQAGTGCHSHPNLYVVASEEERQRGEWYIRQTFGEELRSQPQQADTPLELPPAAEWKQAALAFLDVKRHSKHPIV